MNHGEVDFSKVSGLITLIRNGDGPSLGKLRELIGQSPYDISTNLGISEQELTRWERGMVMPDSKQMTKWRLKLSHDIDGEVSRLLGTENPDVLHEFWELAWRLG